MTKIMSDGRFGAAFVMTMMALGAVLALVTAR